MAVRTMSARLCRYCRYTEAQNAPQRRSASTSTVPVEVEELEEGQSQAQASTSPGLAEPVASTSRLAYSPNPKINNILLGLRFEVNQAIPARESVWKQLNTAHELSPSALAQQEELLRKTIPILSRHTPPPTSAKGLGKIIAVQEEAEALYARYRFISNRLAEAGNRLNFQQQSTFAAGMARDVQLKRKEAQQADAIAKDEETLLWLRSVEELGYAPAAWRIWGDHIKRIEGTAPFKRTQFMAHSVLVATMKWLVFQRDRNVETASFRAQAKECLRNANHVVTYLRENGLYDWIARSIMLRMMKEIESKPDLHKFLKSEYNFDVSFPSLTPFDDVSDVKMPSVKKMDPHTFNTVLNYYAGENDLSKMISLFETATGARPIPFEQRDTFLSNNTSANTFAARQGNTTGDSEALPTQAKVDGHLPPQQLDLSSVNTHSFELMIVTALRLDRARLAHHYHKLALSAWKQERLRVRSAYENLVRWDGRSQSLGELQNLIPEAISAPRVAISIPTFLPLYMQFKHSKSERQRHAPILKSVLATAQEAVDLLRHDIKFWARAYDAEDVLGHAIEAHPESTEEIITNFRRYRFRQVAHPLNLKTHLLLQTRLKVELRELAGRIEAVMLDIAPDRYLAPILYDLSMKHLDPKRSSRRTVAQMSNAVKRAERWLSADTTKDKERIHILTRTLKLSPPRFEAKMRERRASWARRRTVVRQAVEQAKSVLKEAKIAAREAKEAQEAEQTAILQDRLASHTSIITDTEKQLPQPVSNSRESVELQNDSSRHRVGNEAALLLS